MTKDERNLAICAYYREGRKLTAVASHFQLGRQRILQILKAGNAWKPYETGKRTQFLGVTVRKETKDGLAKMALSKGVSVSQLTSDALDGLIK